jgi:hypothetical protein
MLTFSQIQSRINEAFNTAFLMKSTATELNERLDRYIRNEVNSKSKSGRNNYNQFVKGFVMGQINLQHEFVYKHLEFCYLIDNVLYSTSKESEKPKVEMFYAGGNSDLLSLASSGHYWKGTDKKFF